jgi:hypothetical protein
VVGEIKASGGESDMVHDASAMGRAQWEVEWEKESMSNDVVGGESSG